MNNLTIRLEIMKKNVAKWLASGEKLFIKDADALAKKDEEIKLLKSQITELKAKLKKPGKTPPQEEKPVDPVTPTTPTEPTTPTDPATPEEPVDDVDLDPEDLAGDESEEDTVPTTPIEEAPDEEANEVVTPPKPQPKPDTKPPVPIVRTQLRAVADFVKGFPKNFRAHIKRESAIKVVTKNTTPNGEPLCRLELTAEDIKKLKAVRAEMLYTEHNDIEQKLGYMMWVPSKDWEIKEPTADIITQWHSWEDKDKGEKAQVPPMALYIVNGKLGFMINWDDALITTPERRKRLGYKKTFNLGPAPVGKFTKMVYHIRFSHKSDGFVKIWMDDVLKVDYKGPNCYNDKDRIPYLKWGIYKRKFPKCPKRSIFFGPVRLGGSNTPLESVKP